MPQKAFRKILSLNLAFIVFFAFALNSLFCTEAFAAAKYVVYRGNGGKTTDGKVIYEQSVASYDNVELMSSDLFKSPNELVFIGWNTQSNGRGTWYNEGETCSLAEGTELYAQWGAGRVTFHGNGGLYNGKETTLKYYKSSYDQLYGNDEYKREGYALVGWNTAADGSGIWYEAGEFRTRYYGIVDLYAQWQQIPEKYLCLNAGESNVFGGQPIKYLAIDEFPCTVTLPELSDTDSLHVIAWSTEKFHSPKQYEGGTYEYTTGINYEGGDELQISENQTLYCFTTKKTEYQLFGIYHGNGGLNKYDQRVQCVIASGGDLIIFGRSSFSRESYNLTGWNTKPDGSGTAYDFFSIVPRSQYERGSVIPLYAQWEYDPEAFATDKYVVYRGNGGQTSDGKQVYEQPVVSYDNVQLMGSDLFKSSNELVFIGWNTNSRGKGTWYNEGERYSLEEETELYAQWGAGRVTYHGNGGLYGDKESVLEYYTSSYNKLYGSNEFKREGYVLVGWNTAADGSGKWYEADEWRTQYYGIVDLYAQWQELPEKYLCLNAGRANVFGGQPVKYIPIDEFPYTVTLPELADTEELHTIAWSTEKFHSPKQYEGGTYEYTTGINYEGGDEITISENRTLYCWTEKKSERSLYGIYHGNGGLNKYNSSVQCVIASGGDLIIFGRSSFSREGYNLLGWNSKPDGSGTAYDFFSIVPCSQYDRGSVIPLYAQWEFDPLAEHDFEVDADAGFDSDSSDAMVVLYDSNGRMINFAMADYKSNKFKASVLSSDYVKSTECVLFEIRKEDFAPLSQAHVIK